MDPSVMEETMTVLGGIFKKPKMSEKLLSKPPFRFLHDCVTSTMKSVDTEFCQGLFEESEMDSKGFSDKSGKCVFLDKMINYVGICTGQAINARSNKVVAGLEPEATNMFLAAMGRVATNSEIDHAEATKRTLNNESPGDRSPPMKGGSSAAEAKDSPSHPSAQSKSLDDEAKGSDMSPSGAAATFAEEAKRASDVPSTRSGTRGGARDRGAPQTSDAGLGDTTPPRASAADKQKTGTAERRGLDKEIEACNSDPERTRVVMERIVQKPKCSDKLLGKPPFRFLHDLISAVIRNTGFGRELYGEDMMDSKNVKDKQAKIQYLERIIQAVGSHLNTIVDARPAKIVAGLEAENTCTFLQLLALAANNQGGAGGDTTGGEQPAEAKSPAKDEEEQQQEAKSPEGRGEVAQPKQESPKKTPVGAKQDDHEQAKSTPGGGKDGKDNGDGGGQGGPKSMRPTTARRRPPKVKENTSVTSVQETVTANKGVKKVAIMKEGAEDDFFDDEPEGGEEGGESKGGEVAIGKDGERRSLLVKKIMREQEEEKRDQDKEMGNKEDGKKGIRLTMSLNKGGVMGGMSATDLNNLTKSVQRLVQSTAPLGKCMDYVQEDLTQMTKEGERWGNHFRSNIDAFMEAKKRTEEDLTPLKGQLRELEDQIEEVKEKIRGTKTNIVKNDERVRGLLRGVVSN